MNEDIPNQILFHNDAAQRFNSLAHELLNKVGSFGSIQSSNPTSARKSEIHPAFTFTAEHIIGEIDFQEHSVNGLNEETGRFWNSNGLRVGWQGAEFAEIQKLVKRIEASSALRGRISYKFLLDETFNWLKDTLEQKRHDGLTDYLAERCSKEIQNYELWIPVYRTHSSREFSIGDVVFRTISKTLFDQFYSGIPKEEMARPEVSAAINHKRSKTQGSIAACINVTAEYEKASEIALATASDAIGLLRFISSVNWTSGQVSHCLPHGKENIHGAIEFVMEGSSKIKRVHERTLQRGPSGWNVDEARSVWPGLLERVDELAKQRQSTEFKAALYDAMILYSHASVETDITGKFVFLLAALESFFLRDKNEPIQTNLAERMAFLIADTVQERRRVIKNVKRFYSIRSDFIHHGQAIASEDREVADDFVFSAWFCFVRLLAQMDQFKTKSDLFNMLEEKKLG